MMTNPSPKSRCPYCEYELNPRAQSVVLRCPECGRSCTIEEADPTRNRKRPWRDLLGRIGLLVGLPMVLSAAALLISAKLFKSIGPESIPHTELLGVLVLYVVILPMIVGGTLMLMVSGYKRRLSFRKSTWQGVSIAVLALLGNAIVVVTGFVLYLAWAASYYPYG